MPSTRVGTGSTFIRLSPGARDYYPSTEFTREGLRATQGSTESLQRKCIQVRVEASGIIYRSCSATSYLSLAEHRGPSDTKHAKSVWKLSRPDECHTFCISELHGWLDKDGHRWAVASDGDGDLGTRGERLAFFWSPANQHDPWHGFPVSAGRRGMTFHRRPPDELIQKWEDDGLISFVTSQRLRTRRG